MSKDNKTSIFLLFFALQFITFKSLNAAEFSVESFGKIIVLEAGRKKPIDTYARNKLLQFSGKQSIHNKSALEWISDVMFEPSNADNDLIFLINNPEIADALGIEPRVKRRYSFSDLFNAMPKLYKLSDDALKKDSRENTSFDKEIILLRQNVDDYFSLKSFFSFAEPYPDFAVRDSSLASYFGCKSDSMLSYLDLLSRAGLLSEAMKSIKDKDFDNLTNQDKEVLYLTKNMYIMGTRIENPQPYMIPVKEGSKEEWFSPWGYIGKYQSEVLNNELVMDLIKIREAFLKRDQNKFNESIKSYEKTAATLIEFPDPGLELLYNKTNPFLFSKILYGLAAIFALLALLISDKYFHLSSFLFGSIGLLFHTLGIISRMIIMSHPPVTNLYETFVFVAWAAAGLGIILEVMKLRNIGILISSVTGFLFLHIAARYALEGDTLSMLAAVLDSSFWLTTHIVTIALGYAGCMVAGIIGHFYLMYVISGKKDSEFMSAAEKSLYGIFLFGFAFSVIGTVFGGMWADQAWGRFWGWDPKENGALLIILWCLIIIHARKTGLIRAVGIAFGSIVGTVLVMCTWIGVNLLGIGMHSYGFTSAGTQILFTYLCIEIVFISVTGIMIISGKKKKMFNIS